MPCIRGTASLARMLGSGGHVKAPDRFVSSAEAMRLMGEKTLARRTMIDAGGLQSSRHGEADVGYR